MNSAWQRSHPPDTTGSILWITSTPLWIIRHGQAFAGRSPSPARQPGDLRAQPASRAANSPAYRCRSGTDPDSSGTHPALIRCWFGAGSLRVGILPVSAGIFRTAVHAMLSVVRLRLVGLESLVVGIARGIDIGQVLIDPGHQRAHRVEQSVAHHSPGVAYHRASVARHST